MKEKNEFDQVLEFLSNNRGDIAKRKCHQPESGGESLVLQTNRLFRKERDLGSVISQFLNLMGSLLGKIWLLISCFVHSNVHFPKATTKRVSPQIPSRF